MIQIRYQFFSDISFLIHMKRLAKALHRAVTRNPRNQQNLQTTSINGANSFYGEASHLVTQAERNTFGIGTSNDVKNLVEKAFGRRPTDIFLKDPTNWSDATYANYGWDPVTTRLEPINIKLLEITQDDNTVETRIFENNLDVDSTVDITFSSKVSNTVGSKWSLSDTVQFGTSVTAGVNIEVFSGQMTVSANFSSTYGQEKSVSETIELQVSSGMGTVIHPGETILAELIATHGKAKFEITYRARLAGDVFINYNPPFDGHHFWADYIDYLLKYSGMSNSKQVKQIVEVGNYGNARITLSYL